MNFVPYSCSAKCIRRGLLDDRREVHRARERAEPSELFVKLRIGGELNLVPGGR